MNSKINITNDESNCIDFNFINENTGDLDKLLSLFDELDINEDDNNSNWLKKPLNERIKIWENKVKKFKKYKKANGVNIYNYPKDSE